MREFRLWMRDASISAVTQRTRRGRSFSYIAQCIRRRCVCIGSSRSASAHTCVRARARYDQVGVITRKHKLTICPGVLVSLATSRVQCNNWYTLSSATLPTTNPLPPPAVRPALAHHPLSSLDGVASTTAVEI